MTVDSGITVDLSGKRILVTHADRFMGPVRNYRDTHFKNSHQRSVFITFVSHGNHNLEWVSLQFSLPGLLIVSVIFVPIDNVTVACDSLGSISFTEAKLSALCFK